MKSKSSSPDMTDEEICARLDWIRPIFTTMQAIAIPDAIAQKTMAYLLEQLDKELILNESQTRH